MFLRNYWYVAAQSDELSEKPFHRILLNEDIALLRFPDGQAAAFEDACPHRKAPLSKGRMTEKGLMCGYHGLTFAANGRCSDAPLNDRIPARAQVKSYPVIEQFGWVWIWLGDEEPEPFSNITDLFQPYFSSDAVHGYGYHYVKCYYELITDNLLDLSHVSVVHKGTLGTGLPRPAETNTVIEDDTVKLFRYVRDNEVPPYLHEQLGHLPRIDEISEMIWQAPARLAIRVGGAMAGQSLDDSQAFVLNTDLITPETESTTHYFWTIGRKYKTDDQKITEQMVNMTRTAFDEDVEILEAQGQRLPNGDIQGERLVSCREDKAPMQARSILKQIRTHAKQ